MRASKSTRNETFQHSIPPALAVASYFLKSRINRQEIDLAYINHLLTWKLQNKTIDEGAKSLMRATNEFEYSKGAMVMRDHGFHRKGGSEWGGLPEPGSQIQDFLLSKQFALRQPDTLTSLLEPSKALFSMTAHAQAYVEVLWNRCMRDDIHATIEDLDNRVKTTLSETESVLKRVAFLHELLVRLGGQASVIDQAWNR